MLIPIVIGPAVAPPGHEACTASGDGKSATGCTLRVTHWHKIIPAFLVGFLAATTLDALGAIPSGRHSPLSTLGIFLITTALAGIGLSMRPADMRRASHCPLLLGAIRWARSPSAASRYGALTGML